MNAQCRDLDVGYACYCNTGYVDISPDHNVGRVCLKGLQLKFYFHSDLKLNLILLDPCQDPSINDCWLKRCTVLDIHEATFNCSRCPASYIDQDPQKPGRKCIPSIKLNFQTLFSIYS